MGEEGRRKMSEKEGVCDLSYSFYELPRQIALSQLLNVANPLVGGKWSKHIVPKEFVYSKYVCFEHSVSK